MLRFFKTSLFCIAIGALCPLSGMAQDSNANEAADTKPQADTREAPDTQSEAGENPQAQAAPRKGLTSDVDSFFEEIEEDARSGDLDTSCSLPPEGIS